MFKGRGRKKKKLKKEREKRKETHKYLLIGNNVITNNFVIIMKSENEGTRGKHLPVQLPVESLEKDIEHVQRGQ